MYPWSKHKNNYCSGIFDRIGDYDLSGCCKVHDEDYDDPNVTRLEADLWFRSCLEKTSNKLIAYIYFIGVRTFGWIFFRNHKL